MSIYDEIHIKAENEEAMRSCGAALAASLYPSTKTIVLEGPLGAGKTTFVQGLARGLGVQERVVSPSYAIEHRYGETLLHMDVFRLPKESVRDVLMASEEFSGIRVIEWGERASEMIEEEGRIGIRIHEAPHDARQLHVRFQDVRIPAETQREEWKAAVKLPHNISDHMNAVARVADLCAQDVIRRGGIVRTRALQAAALLHDLLRFVDFLDEEKTARAHPEETLRLWRECHTRYPGSHEVACHAFLAEQGFPDIGLMIRTHGAPWAQQDVPRTIEQKLLTYADKRAKHDTIVSLQERFDDFVERYGKGRESEAHSHWHKKMEELERELFPDGPPL